MRCATARIDYASLLMIHRLTRATRLLTLLFAAMQFAVPAVASVVDGAAGAERGAGSHVEDFGRNKCTPPHSADCAICRFLSTTHSQASAPVVAAVVAKVAANPESLVAFATTTARAGFNSRAPPPHLG